MKKNINKILLLLLLFMPSIVLANGGIKVSPTSLTIEEGSTKTITITATNMIGDVYIKTGNSSVASINISEWSTGMVDEGQTKTGTVKVTGKKVGTAQITLEVDGATFDEEVLTGQKKVLTVNVVAKAKTAPSSNDKPKNSQQPVTDNRSSNNKLKELKVEGYDITKVDNNHYNLTVNNTVESITVSATAEDAKAKISGAGNHELKAGDNNIDIIITAENGSKNKIVLKVTKKENNTLEDLDNLLKDSSVGDINIAIKADDKISKEQLESIKNSKKRVNFLYSDESNNSLYTIIIDGTKIKDLDDINVLITNNSDNAKNIAKLSNYADGIILNTNELPSGLLLKIDVSNKYLDGDLINVYYYDNNKLTMLHELIPVKDGHIEFELNDSKEYFATMSTISMEKVSAPVVTNNNFNYTLYTLLMVVGLEVIIFIIIILIKRKKSNKVVNSSNFDQKEEQNYEE